MSMPGTDGGGIFKLLKSSVSGITSRGAIPHITPDVISRHSHINGVYMALEDFVEKSVKRASPAIFDAPASGLARPLHTYTSTPSESITILGARRHPAVVAPMGNGLDFISIYTSTGFQKLTTEQYWDTIARVKPDIVIPLADLTFGATTPNAKRQLRMAERTEEWMHEFLQRASDEKPTQQGVHVFAPLLPVSYSMQWQYLSSLSEDLAQSLSGLAIYDADILADLESHQSLKPLARLLMDPPLSPHHILRQIRMGADIVAVPFLNAISDAGIALTFTFQPTIQADGTQPLGVDMWSKDHQTSVTPLAEGCTCYACTKHHRAYLQHLLNAKEMLGWTLLQVHNYHTLEVFFAAVRAAIADGTFEEQATIFNKLYDADLPLGTGERPRARGYHFKAEAAQPKMNAPPWKELEGVALDNQALGVGIGGVADAQATATRTEPLLVPTADSTELDARGFASVEQR